MESETQKNKMTCPRSHSLQTFEPRQPCPGSLLLLWGGRQDVGQVLPVPLLQARAPPDGQSCPSASLVTPRTGGPPEGLRSSSLGAQQGGAGVEALQASGGQIRGSRSQIPAAPPLPQLPDLGRAAQAGENPGQLIRVLFSLHFPLPGSGFREESRPRCPLPPMTASWLWW